MTTRTIKTLYYERKGRADVLRTTTGTDANRAVANCVQHMQVDHYGAEVAEVFDESTGELHAVVTRSPATGALRITYRRDPRSHEVRLAFGAVLLDEKKSNKKKGGRK